MRTSNLNLTLLSRNDSTNLENSNLRQGDIVEYIICEDGSGNPATQRAYHRTEMEENKDLKIGKVFGSERKKGHTSANLL
ncbi:unnamed protein product [Caenorhabditis angaria]|uniref:DNA-directed DNA polymerase n=1 Tax=Caenorhabditis angaria TaxID=860376 RepID=A0A9P1IKI3_9PELO|nr:unnamed protein product [Caenorhabditis angaria]